MKKKNYTTFDISKMLEVYPNTVANWIDGGKINAYTTPGGHRRVRRENLLKFLHEQNIPVPDVLEDYSRILIVEDDSDLSEAIQQLLKKDFPEYKLHTAKDGFEAGEKFIEISPSLVILDIMLPGLDGFTVCRQIKKKNRKTEIIAVTGYPTDENKEKIKEAGADYFLPKPFQLSELKKILDKIL